MQKKYIESLLRGLRAGGICLVKDQSCEQKTLTSALDRSFDCFDTSEVEVKEIAELFYNNSAEEIDTNLPSIFQRTKYGNS